MLFIESLNDVNALQQLRLQFPQLQQQSPAAAASAALEAVGALAQRLFYRPETKVTSTCSLAPSCEIKLINVWAFSLHTNYTVGEPYKWHIIATLHAVATAAATRRGLAHSLGIINYLHSESEFGLINAKVPKNKNRHDLSSGQHHNERVCFLSLLM